MSHSESVHCSELDNSKFSSYWFVIEYVYIFSPQPQSPQNPPTTPQKQQNPPTSTGAGASTSTPAEDTAIVPATPEVGQRKKYS